MKRLACEMCGSIDIIKQDGLYVCQSCGTKYSPEDARQMMFDGTVEVIGTVKIDNTSTIINLVKLAEHAKLANNQKEAESYANRILEIDPDNYQAWVFKGKAAAMQSAITNNRLGETFECFSRAIDNAPEDKAEDVKIEISNEISSLSQYLIAMCCDNFEKHPEFPDAGAILNYVYSAKTTALELLMKYDLKPFDYEEAIAAKMHMSVYNAWVNKILPDYNGNDGKPNRPDWEKFVERANSCINVLKSSINFSEEDSQADINRYRNLIDISKTMMNSCAYELVYTKNNTRSYVKGSTINPSEKAKIQDEIMGYHEKIKDLDPSYVIPKKAGCYIATAVYGSYDCPQVWALRRYRDYFLAETWHGRAFIWAYYAVSPALIKLFGESNWFKGLWRGPLDSLVGRLLEQGIEDTEYEDKF